MMSSDFWSLAQKDGKFILIFCESKMIFDTKEKALEALVYELNKLLLNVLHDTDDNFGTDASTIMIQ